MNEKIWKPVLLLGAAALCLWGVYGVLSRPEPSPKTPAAPAVSSGAGEAGVSSTEWERLLPAAPEQGLAPARSGIPAGAAPSPAALIRTVTLADGSTLRLELEGSSFESGAYGTRYRLDSITVRRDGGKLQVLTFEAPYYQHEPAADSLESNRPDFGFSTGDYNFDGQIDFSVSAGLVREDGCSADYSYHFLWSPEREYLVPSPELDVLPSPKFSEQDQSITCTYSGTERYGRVLYHCMRGELLPVEKWEQTLDREKGVLNRTLSAWEDGGWTTVDTTEEEAVREISRTLSLNEGGRRLLLTLTGTVERQGAPPEKADEQGTLTRIELRTEDGRTVQEIALEPFNISSNLEYNGFDTDLLDLNFDGYTDLRVQSSWGTGGTFYRCFLWDPSAGQFRENAQLSGYGDPRPDPVAKEIVTRDNGGYDSYTETHLRWEGDELVPVRRVKTVYEESAVGYCTSRRILFVYEDGAWKEQAEEPPKEAESQE